MLILKKKKKGLVNGNMRKTEKCRTPNLKEKKEIEEYMQEKRSNKMKKKQQKNLFPFFFFFFLVLFCRSYKN